MDGLARPVDLPQYRSITGVLNTGIEVVLDKIEESLKVGVTTMLCMLLPSGSDFSKDGEDFLRCNGSELPVLAEVIAKLGQRGGIQFNCISPRIHLMIFLINLDRLFKFHGMTPDLIGSESQNDGYHYGM